MPSYQTGACTSAYARQTQIATNFEGTTLMVVLPIPVLGWWVAPPIRVLEITKYRWGYSGFTGRNLGNSRASERVYSYAMLSAQQHIRRQHRKRGGSHAGSFTSTQRYTDTRTPTEHTGTPTQKHTHTYQPCSSGSFQRMTQNDCIFWRWRRWSISCSQYLCGFGSTLVYVEAA